MNVATSSPVFARPTDKPPAPPTQIQAALREMRSQPPGAGSLAPTVQTPNPAGMDIVV